MTFYVIGIDYRRTPIDIRETAYRRFDDISRFWDERTSQKTAILVTCNRIEIYGASGSQEDARHYADLFLDAFPDIFGDSYVLYGKKDVLGHAIRLAVGLESQLIGEGQIIEQLDRWHDQGSFPPQLYGFWHKAIGIGREIRKITGLWLDGPNVAELIYGDLAGRLDHDTKMRVIIVGTGKVAELFSGLCRHNLCLSFVANKNRAKAQRLARHSGGEAIIFEDLPAALVEADAVVSATKSPHFIFNKNYFLDISLKRRKGIYVYDVAVPRDVEPDVGSIDGVVLKNLDDLAEIFSTRHAGVQDKIGLADYLIEEALEERRGDVICTRL